MHTYKFDESSHKWVVGYWRQTGSDYLFWETLEVFKHKIQAVGYVNYLNGGMQDITLISEMLEQNG